MASVSDDFNRADSGSLGAGWTQDEGTFSISSNVAIDASAGDGRARFATALDSSDHSSQADIVTTGNGGVFARAASSTNTFYGAKYLEYWSQKLIKRVAGADTELDSYASGASATTFKLTVDGSTQSVSANSVDIMSAADSAITTGTYSGIFSIWYAGVDWDNFYAEDLAAGATYTLTAEAGSHTITGTVADLLYNRVLSAESGGYVLTGQDADLLFNRVLSADPGSYVLTGQDVTLTYTPDGGPTYTLTADSGSIALTGSGAELLYNRVLAADVGSYSISGQDAALLFNRALSADTGSYVLAGTAAVLIKDYVLSAEAGAYILTGQAAALTYSGFTVPVGVVSFTIDAAVPGLTITASSPGANFAASKPGITISAT